MTNLAAIETDYRAIGDTTLDVYRAELTRTHSPMLPTAADTYAAARPHSALFLAQAWLENRYETTGIILGPEDHNPVSLRPERYGETGPYGMYVITASDGGQFLAFRSDADCAREWKRRLFDDPSYKGGMYARTRTLAEMLAVYAPSGDVHPVTGLDNADAGYLTSVTTMLRKYAAMEAGAGTVPEPVEDTPMATHRYILSAGHRNTDGGGAWRGPESAWTYPICQKLKAAIERRGGEAWIIQEEDGDKDPSFCVGRGLQNAARLCVDLAKAVGGVDAYLSMHYGAEPADGFFSVYPDATGLYPASSVDIAANNPLDIRLARVFAENVAKTGMPKRTGGVQEAGVMAESQSYVGSQGSRLGELYGTIGFRDTTARLIVEAGNSLDDREYGLLWSASWQDAYVEALVDGLEEVFGAFPKATPKPTPETPKPAPQYADAKPVADLQDGRPFLITSGDSTYIRADLLVKATKATPRLQYADPTSKHIGPDIAAGEEFAVDYIILNPDGSRYWYTPWATRVAYDDTEIVAGETAADAA